MRSDTSRPGCPYQDKTGQSGCDVGTIALFPEREPIRAMTKTVPVERFGLRVLPDGFSAGRETIWR